MTFTWVAFIIQALFSKVFLSPIPFDHLSILIVALTSLFFLFDLSRHNYPREIFIILFSSYLLRLFLMFFDIYGREIYVLPSSGVDSEMFQKAALIGLKTGDYGNGHIYSFFIGLLYSFFGQQRMIPQFFNVLLSMHAIILLYKTMDLYKISAQAKYLSLAIAAWLPNFALMSSILLRESIIIFLYILSFYLFSKGQMERNWLLLVLSYGLGLLVAVFHSGSIVLVVAYTVILILYDQSRGSFNINYKSVLLAFVFSIIFMYIFENYFDVFLAKFSRIETIEDITNIDVMGESGYSIGFATENPVLDLIINTPIRIVYFVFSPFPWEWRGISDVIAFFFSSLFYSWVLFIAFRSLFKRNLTNKNQLIIVLLVIVIGLVIFSWGVSNVGTALRHRDKFVGLFIVLLALIFNEETYTKEVAASK